MRLFCVCVVLRLASGLATNWSPVQGVLPSVYRSRNWSETKRFADALCSSASNKNIKMAHVLTIMVWAYRRYGAYGMETYIVHLMILINLQTKTHGECLRIILHYAYNQSGHLEEGRRKRKRPKAASVWHARHFRYFRIRKMYVYFLLPEWTLGSEVWHFDDTEQRVVTFCWA
jgi:hypothetical protein